MMNYPKKIEDNDFQEAKSASQKSAILQILLLNHYKEQYLNNPTRLNKFNSPMYEAFDLIPPEEMRSGTNMEMRSMALLHLIKEDLNYREQQEHGELNYIWIGSYSNEPDRFINTNRFDNEKDFKFHITPRLEDMMRVFLRLIEFKERVKTNLDIDIAFKISVNSQTDKKGNSVADNPPRIVVYPLRKPPLNAQSNVIEFESVKMELLEILKDIVKDPEYTSRSADYYAGSSFGKVRGATRENKG